MVAPQAAAIPQVEFVPAVLPMVVAQRRLADSKADSAARPADWD